MVVKRIVVAHQFGLPSFHDWKHAIGEVRQRRLSVLLRPIVEFAFRNQIARFGESRRPTPALQPRVPADMIDMQMRAHDEIDIIHAKTRGGQRAHKVLVALEIPFRSRRPHLVVADATVNQNDMMRRAHDIGLETEDQPVILTKGFGRKPVAILLEHFRRESRKHVKRRQKRPLQLNDAMNADVADAQELVHCGFPAGVARQRRLQIHINKNRIRRQRQRARRIVAREAVVDIGVGKCCGEFNCVWPASIAKRSDKMTNDVPGESNRVRRLFREQFTFQISVDTYYVPQGLAVAEAALKAGVTILELGTPLLKYEGVRNVVPIFRQRFPKALLLADMKTMDGGEGEANAVYSGGGNVIDFLASAGEATAKAVCAVRDTFRQADPAIPRLAFADVLIPMQGPAGRRSRRRSACSLPAWTASASTCSTTPGGPTPPSLTPAT